MLKYFSFVFLVTSFVSCNSPSGVNQHTIVNDETPPALYERDTLPNGIIKFRPNYSSTSIDTSEIQLVFFTAIPETIPDAHDLYTYDTTQLTSKKYIFLTDLTEYAIIKNNGKDIYLKKQYEKSERLSENTFKDVFSGNGYTINFTHKKLSHKNGKTYEQGLLEIENAKHKAIIKIHGGYEL